MCVCQRVSENQWAAPSVQKEESLVVIVPFSSSSSNPHISGCLLLLARTKLPLDSAAKCRPWMSQTHRESAVVCIIGHVIILEWPLPLDSQSVFVSRSVGCSTLYIIPLWPAPTTMAAHFSPAREKLAEHTVTPLMAQRLFINQRRQSGAL
jgi:hypothetical protein